MQSGMHGSGRVGATDRSTTTPPGPEPDQRAGRAVASAESRPDPRKRRATLAVVLAFVVAIAAIAGCSDDSSAPPKRTIPNPGGTFVPGSNQSKNVLGTATITQLNPATVGTLPAAYCAALIEFDNKYGPLHQPQIALKAYPDAIRLFRLMKDTAPPDIAKRLEEPIAIADQFQAAIASGEVNDEKTTQSWVDKNLGKEGVQRFLAGMVTVLFYSAPACGIGKKT